MSVYYGNKDWMDKDHAIKVNEQLGLGLDIQIIEGSGHQIIFERPVELAKRITLSQCFDFFINDVDLKENVKKYDIMDSTKYIEYDN